MPKKFTIIASTQKPWHEGGKPSPGLSARKHSPSARTDGYPFMIHRQDVSACHAIEPGFMKIPHTDLVWVMDQKPSVIRLFHECWLCDPYGSRWMQLTTALKDRAFREAKKKLSEYGLFVFKPEASIRDGRSNVCWLVKNLHGSRVESYWSPGGTPMPDNGTPMPDNGTPMPDNGTPTANNAAPMPPISPQTLTQSGSQ